MASGITVTGSLKKRWLSTIGKSDEVTAVSRRAYDLAKAKANQQAMIRCQRAGLRTVYDVSQRRYLPPERILSFHRGNSQRGVWNTTYTLWPTYRSSKLDAESFKQTLDTAARATGAELKRRH